jgi:hypothetical protein
MAANLAVQKHSANGANAIEDLSLPRVLSQHKVARELEGRRGVQVREASACPIVCLLQEQRVVQAQQHPVEGTGRGESNIFGDVLHAIVAKERATELVHQRWPFRAVLRPH